MRRLSKKNSEKSTENSLVGFLSQLENHVISNAELGKIFSYSILAGLSGFRSDSGSHQEIRFQQVRSVYSQLDSVVRSLNDYALANNDDPVFSVICDLRNCVNPVVENAIMDSRKPVLSVSEAQKPNVSNGTACRPLYERIIDRLPLSMGNYEDVLKRKGITMISYLRQKAGILEGLARVNERLEADYEAINNIFLRNRSR